MKSIRFKNKTYTKTKVKNNIKRILSASNDTLFYNWYEGANEFCNVASDIYNIPQSKVIGILAALSPLKSWDENKNLLLSFLDGDYFGHTSVFINKALDILEGSGKDTDILKTLKGLKISSFYLNIKYPLCAKNVTIDRHAISIATGIKFTENYAMTQNQYNFFKDCYIELAKDVKLIPNELQSITWLNYRL